MLEIINETIIGFSVVIVGMLLLTGIIIVFSKVMARSGKADQHNDVPDNKHKSDMQIKITSKSQDEETIAAIMAAIQVYLAENNIKGSCTISVKPFRRTGWHSAWNNETQCGTENIRV